MLARAEVLSEGEKGFTLFLPCERHKEEVRRAGRYVWVDVPDPRLISREQQKKAHVLIGCIADWYGATPPEMMKVLLKEIFCYEARDAAFLAEGFSLATCSVEEARLFISWLLDFCLLHDVPAGAAVGTGGGYPAVCVCLPAPPSVRPMWQAVRASPRGQCRGAWRQPAPDESSRASGIAALPPPSSRDA